MAISLSELTGASTSGNVLNEVNSYADFLDSVPRLVNKADPTGATDAVQTVATKQPIALPLIDGEGYCYLPQISGNSISFPSANLTGEHEVILKVHNKTKITGHLYEDAYQLRSYGSYFRIQYGSSYVDIGVGNPASEVVGTKWIKLTYIPDNGSGNLVFALYLSDDGETWTSLGSATAASTTLTPPTNSTISANPSYPVKGAIFKVIVKDGIDGTVVTDIDFTSPRIPHGATEFTCETGQVVTVNTSGKNPSKVIKKPVLRFDGVNGGLEGLLGQTITDGYVFAAFSVLGSGGESYGRLFSAADSASLDIAAGGFVLRRHGASTALNLTIDATVQKIILNSFTSDLGDYVLESRLKSAETTVKTNGTVGESYTDTFGIDAEIFNIGEFTEGDYNGSFDLEYLALFPASITDKHADQIRNFINNRNKVFYRWDTDGYYFFDAASTTDGEVLWAQAWNGRIVGSDNGDADMFIGNGTAADRPTTDGYKITFADNTDHFDIPSTSQAGWQIVGTSLGTFAYKVSGSSITTFNLLGNETSGSYYYRKLGDLYGIILLPESATNRDIEEARKLLIDRGAGDGATTTNYNAAWAARYDIVDFKNTEFSGVTSLANTWQSCLYMTNMGAINAPNCANFSYAWDGTINLQQFPSNANLGKEASNVYFTGTWRSSKITSFSTPLPTASRVDYAWYNCQNLSSFTTTDLKNCSNFGNAWRGCSSLQSFPEDALLGTEASDVNFSNAWRGCSSLTSFPLIDTSNVTNFTYAWRDCNSLTSFPLIDTSSGANFFYAWYNCNSLTSFPLIDTSSSADFQGAWRGCSSLVDFPAGLFDNWNPTAISTATFADAWLYCVLSTQSVENILTSIAASGKWATNDGTSGGTALSNANIRIDYDVSTGSLTAATLSAIETLNGRGWSVNINNEIIVPNILQLQPAAAYSLRSFDADADPTVVNVRRSSDGSLSDFTASQVSDGTLRDWTLGDALALDGQRMHFDGIDDKVDVSSLDISNLSEITIKTRILWQNGIDANEGIFTNGSTSSDRFGLYISNQLTFYIGDGTQTFYPNLVSLNTNQYYDVVATAKVENGQMTARMFVDGVSDNETFRSTSATDFSVVAQNWVIGYLNVNRYFKGIIDYVEVYEGYSTDGSVTGMTALHKWTNTNTTNASWVDQVGSIDGTVSGSPALFSGQGFNGYVTTFYDQSSNGNNSTQSTASEQPLIVQNGVLVTENGEAATLFSGAQWMDMSGLNSYTGLTDMSLFGVIRTSYTANTARYNIFTAINTSSGDNILRTGVSAVGTNALFLYTETTQADSYATYASVSDEQTLIGFDLLSSPTGYVNGAAYTQGLVSSGVNLQADATWQIGQEYDGSSPSDFFDGKMQEVVIFTNDQSANRQGIDNNIMTHYGIE